MDLESLSIEGICALKQAQIQSEASVRVMKGINDQAKVLAAILFGGLEKVLPPESGKGQKLDTVA